MAQRKLNLQEQLVSRLRERDRGAQYEIYEMYSVAMFNTALRIVGHRAEAEDVLQEAFLAAFTRIELYKSEATFGAWLKRIVVNKSINSLQKRRAELVPLENAPLNSLTAESTSPEAPIWNVEQISNALKGLSDGYRVVFSLYLMEGYDHREIADILGISEGGSKSQLARAKKKIRELLNAQNNV